MVDEATRVIPSDGAVRHLVALGGREQIDAFLAQPAQHNHMVQFYEDEQFLVDNVAHFIAAGLRGGEPIIIIATEAHRTAFADHVRLHGLDVEKALASGQLTMLDARKTLGELMVGDRPDWERFRRVIGSWIERIRGEGKARVRAYGEMVDLLWRDGNRVAAIQLEEFWNDIGHDYSFSLLCAYVMGNFYRAEDAEDFARVCRTHTHVIPSEITSLQKQTRALKAEIEHRKELESALREALAREKSLREEAERSVRYNEMFAGTLGHDLRNPLATITMGANYLAREKLGEKPTRVAMRIVSSAERMSRMIDQLLDFTRIRIGGGLDLNRSRVDLSDVCDRVKDEIEAGNPQCNIGFKKVGNTAGLWDYDRMLQVFSNLIANAVSHGSPQCSVSIETNGSDHTTVIAEVHNDGAIAADILPAIFDPFRSGKRHGAKGLGLGLFITKQIVQAHGGAISVKSSETDGTTVRVTLPRFPAETEPGKVEM
jgi:signal transduction histidine kinase